MLGHGRFAILLSRDRLRLLDLDHIYWLEATGETTLVRTRSRRRLRDARPLGEIVGSLPASLFIRAHRNHAVNIGRIREVRRRKRGRDWELVLEPPVNRVLPVSRDALSALRAALGQGHPEA